MTPGAVPLSLIASVARNRVIGSDNQLVWHEPQDQRWFRQQTLGCPVVMGRKTWDSLPQRFQPLPGRPNIVVTRQPGFAAAGAQVAPGLAQALTLARAAATQCGAAKMFVIGGGEMYAQALPLADELLLTEIDADLPGTAQFPAWDRSHFIETRRQSQRSTGAAPCDFAFVTYQRQR